MSTSDGVLVARHERTRSAARPTSPCTPSCGPAPTTVIDGVTVTGWFIEDFRTFPAAGMDGFVTDNPDLGHQVAGVDRPLGVPWVGVLRDWSNRDRWFGA